MTSVGVSSLTVADASEEVEEDSYELSSEAAKPMAKRTNTIDVKNIFFIVGYLKI